MDKLSEVRRTIVRISFTWKIDRVKKKGKDIETEPMVICGVIASIDSVGSCRIVTTSVFFKKGRQSPLDIKVNFPQEDGYEEESVVPVYRLMTHGDFVSFDLAPKQAGYVKQACFDSRPVQTLDEAFVLSFPRESYITPAGYRKGNIVFASPENDTEFYFQDSSFAEYGHFGAPVFNEDGHIIGICFNSQIRSHVWTGDSLKAMILDKLDRSITYVPGQEG